MTITTPSGAKHVAGYLMPERDPDRGVHKRIRQCEVALREVLPRCAERRAAVQGGGNYGVWPKLFAEVFDAVYTAEPDPLCFNCMCVNTIASSNVIRLQAAWGAERAMVDLNREPRYCGAQFVEGEGIFPTLRIDDLGLPHCDLIYVDIEGLEFAALQGASETIGRCRPVVAFEDKHHGARFGVGEGDLEQWLVREHGYRNAGNIGRHDRLMLPC